MGFRTIALDKKASEVWKVLGAVRTQYDKFEGLLLKVKKKIDEAGSTIEDAQKRNSIIQKNLKSVELTFKRSGQHSRHFIGRPF